MLDIYQIYSHKESPMPQDRLLGRILFTPTRVFILEDFHNTLDDLFNGDPGEGQLELDRLAQSPYFTVKGMNDPQAPPMLEPQDMPNSTNKWLLTSPELDEPKILLLVDGQYMLDGKTLDPDEVAQLLSQLDAGDAQLQAVADLNKSEVLPKSSNPEDILAHLQSFVGNGLKQEHVDSLRQHLFEDPRAPGVGNRKAWEQFSSKQKEGVYVSMDLNNLHDVNSLYGHLGGDTAITIYGQALRQAADFVGSERMKVWLPSGDEGLAYSDSPEHAVLFMQKVHELIMQAPLLQNTHQVSLSFGIGNSYEEADMALFKAKELKQQHLQKDPAISRLPCFAFSAIPGKEGPIKLK